MVRKEYLLSFWLRSSSSHFINISRTLKLRDGFCSNFEIYISVSTKGFTEFEIVV